MFTLDDPESIRDSGMKSEIDTDPSAVALIHRALRECEIPGVLQSRGHHSANRSAIC
jgi:hypothetical protein